MRIKIFYFKVSMKAYLFLLSVLIASVSYAQKIELDEYSEKAYKYALQLRIDSSRSIIKTVDPSAFNGYVLNLTNVAELLITESRTRYHILKDQYDSLYSAIDKTEEEPFRSFYLAEMQSSWSLVYAKFGEEFNAGWALRSAYRKASSAYDDFPNFYPIRKTLGLLEVLIGSVPDRYNWILRLLGMRGDVANGIEHLRSVGNQNDLYSYEARGMIAVLYSYLLHKEGQASAILTKMRDEDQDNLLVHYLLISSLIKDHKGKRALAESKSFVFSDEYIDVPFLLYLRAELYIQRAEYQSSIRNYQLFLKTHRGENYVKDANYKIFLSYWINGQKALADAYHETARNSGSERVEADKHAQRRLSEAEYPNKEIMKIRLFTDGGYYDEADSLVKKLTQSPNLPDPRDNNELIYRRARILHQTGKLDEAITAYKQVIETSKSEKWYFGPNSALQLGYIYRERGEKETAIEYFEMARDFPKHEYSNSIGNKAKVALKELQKD